MMDAQGIFVDESCVMRVSNTGPTSIDIRALIHAQGMSYPLFDFNSFVLHGRRGVSVDSMLLGLEGV